MTAACASPSLGAWTVGTPSVARRAPISSTIGRVEPGGLRGLPTGGHQVPGRQGVLVLRFGPFLGRHSLADRSGLPIRGFTVEHPDRYVPPRRGARWSGRTRP